MSKRRPVSSSDREFLARVEHSAFSNPFSRDRDGVQREIALSAHLDRAGAGDAARVVHERLAKLRELGYTRIDHFGAADQAAARAALLYDAFHELAERFDVLIESQTRDPATSVKVSFADDAIERLLLLGCTREESAHYFAVFYQLRRAYFFIERGLVGESRVMEQLRMRLWSNVFTHDMRLYTRRLWSRMEDFSTLLLGPTGSGKGACAAAIGRSGYIPFDTGMGKFVDNFQQCFTSINLSQYAGALIESELFGHKKGAFTGALQSHEGIFDRCSTHGAILLDEIGDISESLQIKLLNVLQDRVFSPVGSHEVHRFDGRVIAATNRQMDELRQKGGFREDFYYRLCSDVIRVPSFIERVREAPGELTALVSHLVQRLSGVRDEDIEGRVLEALAQSPGNDYTWPGNVRELEQAIRRILLTGRYDVDALASADVADDTWTRLDAEGVLARYCAALYRHLNSFEAAARIAKLDRRTVRKYVLQWEERQV